MHQSSLHIFNAWAGLVAGISCCCCSGVLVNKNALSVSASSPARRYLSRQQELHRLPAVPERDGKRRDHRHRRSRRVPPVRSRQEFCHAEKPQRLREAGLAERVGNPHTVRFSLNLNGSASTASHVRAEMNQRQIITTATITENKGDLSKSLI